MQDPSETTDSGLSRLRYWLRFSGKTIPLGVGSFTVGRHASCSFTFDDKLISRKHAKLEIDDAGALLTDLGSANGVYVNGERISAPTRLADGDRILIGEQELVLVRMTDSWRPSSELVTRVDGRPRRDLAALEMSDADDEDSQPVSSAIHTTRADALDVLGGVAQKMLSKGQRAEAERLLARHLANVVTQVRSGALQDKPEVLAKAADHALRLASATKKSDWANYVVTLYTEAKRPIPSTAIDELYGLARLMPLDLEQLRQYLESLRAGAAELSAADKFLVRRLEGLEQVVAAK